MGLPGGRGLPLFPSARRRCPECPRLRLGQPSRVRPVQVAQPACLSRSRPVQEPAPRSPRPRLRRTRQALRRRDTARSRPSETLTSELSAFTAPNGSALAPARARAEGTTPVSDGTPDGDRSLTAVPAIRVTPDRRSGAQSGKPPRPRRDAALGPGDMAPESRPPRCALTEIADERAGLPKVECGRPNRLRPNEPNLWRELFRLRSLRIRSGPPSAGCAGSRRS